MTDKDDLFKGIDDAADNLFNRYVVKKPQSETKPAEEMPTPAPAAPPSPAPTQAPQASATPATPAPQEPPDTAPSSPPAPAAGASTDIMAQMEEVLLSIDWEVSPANLTKGREVLKELISQHGLNSDSPASLVAGQMDKVLTSMQDNPETVPVSAPSNLRKALEAIRAAVPHGPTPDTEIRKLLSQALSELYAMVATPSEEKGGLELNLTLEGDFTEPPPAIEREAAPAPPAIELDAAPAPPIKPAAAAAAPFQPSEDFELELSLESEVTQEQQGTPVQAETTKILKEYSEALSAAVKNIAPMEKLFANRAGMEKLHAVNKHVREKLAGQAKLLAQTFTDDYSSYTGLGTVNGWLESQLDILNPCVKRLVKVENLFAKTKGYEKLHKLTKKIRTSLAARQEAITLAVGGAPVTHQFDLTGEYPALQPVLDRAPEAPAAVVSVVADPQSLVDNCLGLARQIETGEVESGRDAGQKLREYLEKLKSALAGSANASPGATAAAHSAVASATGRHAAAGRQNTKCRWDWLLKTSWGSQLVGLAPEQVAFESHKTFSSKAFRDKTYFSLKKLKPFPWTNLQNLFSGDLGEVDKSTLNEMELEIAKPPDTFRGSTQSKVYLAILYHQGKGKVFLLDAPTEAISITDEGLWVPGKPGSDIAGTLTMYGSIMPVVALDEA